MAVVDIIIAMPLMPNYLADTFTFLLEWATAILFCHPGHLTFSYGTTASRHFAVYMAICSGVRLRKRTPYGATPTISRRP